MEKRIAQANASVRTAYTDGHGNPNTDNNCSNGSQTGFPQRHSANRARTARLVPCMNRKKTTAPHNVQAQCLTINTLKLFISLFFLRFFRPPAGTFPHGNNTRRMARRHRAPIASPSNALFIR